MARLTIYHRSPIIYRYVIRGVPGDESTNVGQYLVVRFVRATDKDTGKDCIFVVGSMMTAWAKAETIVPFGYASTMLSLNDEVPHAEIPYGSPLLPPHLIDICVVDSTDERMWFRHERSAPLGGLFAARGAGVPLKSGPPPYSLASAGTRRSGKIRTSKASASASTAWCSAANRRPRTSAWRAATRSTARWSTGTGRKPDAP